MKPTPASIWTHQMVGHRRVPMENPGRSLSRTAIRAVHRALLVSLRGTAEPLFPQKRRLNYETQNKGRPLTPRQARRLRQKPWRK